MFPKLLDWGLLSGKRFFHRREPRQKALDLMVNVFQHMQLLGLGRCMPDPHAPGKLYFHPKHLTALSREALKYLHEHHLPQFLFCPEYNRVGPVCLASSGEESEHPSGHASPQEKMTAQCAQIKTALTPGGAEFADDRGARANKRPNDDADASSAQIPKGKHRVYRTVKRSQLLCPGTISTPIPSVGELTLFFKKKIKDVTHEPCTLHFQTRTHNKPVERWLGSCNVAGCPVSYTVRKFVEEREVPDERGVLKLCARF